MALLFSIVISAQTPIQPSEYSQEYSRLLVERQSSDHDFDVNLPIEELISVAPTSYSLQTGNWGAVWHGAVSNANAINEGSARHSWIFVFDTAAGFSNYRLDKAWYKGFGTLQYTNDGTTTDKQGHSTHVTGIIVAVDPSGIPLGIGAECVKAGYLHAVPVEVLNDQGSGNYSWIGSAIYDVNEIAKGLIEKGDFVEYNFSLGGGGSSSMVNDALKEAKDMGVLIFAASGNDYREGVSFPASSPSVNAVGALEKSGESVKRAQYSNYGPEVVLSGAGSNVLSTLINNQLGEKSGTSMAAPTVAGVCAVIASLRPELNSEEVLELAKSIVFDISPEDWDKYTGYGSPMLDSLFNGTPNPPTDPPTDPDPEQPTKDRRDLRVVLDSDYKLLWRPMVENNNRTTYARMTVDYNTDLYAEMGADEINELTAKFFTNRGFLLTDDADFEDAAFWARHFYEMILKKQGVNVKVHQLMAIDGDRTVIVTRKSFSRAKAKIKMMFNPEIRQMQIRA